MEFREWGSGEAEFSEVGEEGDEDIRGLVEVDGTGGKEAEDSVYVDAFPSWEGESGDGEDGSVPGFGDSTEVGES